MEDSESAVELAQLCFRSDSPGAAINTPSTLLERLNDMGIFKRISDIVSANVNELVDRFEDPELMLAQVIREMEDAIADTLDAAAKVIAETKLLARDVEQQRASSARCEARAVAALERGDDAAARRAIAARREHDTLAGALADQLAASEQTAGRLRRQLEAMRIRLGEARRKQATLIARSRAATARRRFVRELPGMPQGDAGHQRFESLCRRIESREAEADALLELCGDPEDLFDDDPDEAALDDELATLKSRLASETGTHRDH